MENALKPEAVLLLLDRVPARLWVREARAWPNGAACTSEKGEAYLVAVRHLAGESDRLAYQIYNVKERMAAILNIRVTY